MPHFHAVVDTNGVATFPAQPQVAIPFDPENIHFRLDGSTKVEFSFDGKEVHGTLASQGETLDVRTKVRSIWFRSTAGVANEVDVFASTL